MLIFEPKTNELIWGDIGYTAMSGPHGNGLAPQGFYDIFTRNVVVGNIGKAFRDSETGLEFFIPIQPKFETERGGFGIHPDGNIPGTLGCIGLIGIDTVKFWQRWLRTPLNERPTLLYINKIYGVDVEKVDPMGYEVFSDPAIPNTSFTVDLPLEK